MREGVLKASGWASVAQCNCADRCIPKCNLGAGGTIGRALRAVDFEGTRGAGCSRPRTRPYGQPREGGAGCLVPLGSLPRAGARWICATPLHQVCGDVGHFAALAFEEIDVGHEGLALEAAAGVD
jgi:hypothetical protein